MGHQGHICKMKGDATVGCFQGGRRGQEVAPPQTPDSLFKFKVTLNRVFID